MMNNEINLENIPDPDGFCRVIREIADDAIREERVFNLCRDLMARNVRQFAEVVIALDDDCVVVLFEGGEVAREGQGFEDGAWVARIEAMAESLESLPIAA